MAVVKKKKVAIMNLKFNGKFPTSIYSFQRYLIKKIKVLFLKRQYTNILEFKNLKFNLSLLEEPVLAVVYTCILVKIIYNYIITFIYEFLCLFYPNSGILFFFFFLVLNILMLILHTSFLIFITV